ncbi:MAG: YcaQ family DNA glycosylase [Methylobacterium mesophilicum]|nr:YcaQ family DNA glycosylase [Methylobacterium mesophilicum]
MVETISQAQARRIAIHAQGLSRPRRAATPTRRDVLKLADRLNLFQIDSVSVLVRAHYMPLFSRLGPYAPTLLEGAARGKRRGLFEYWAHEASLLPLSFWPLMQWRMARARDGEGIYGGLAKFGRERPDLIRSILSDVTARGPLSASEIDGERGAGGWWGWSDTKRAFEWLFWAGLLTASHRRSSFERVYDLPERALPAALLAQPVPEPAEAHRELLALSARAHGIASAQCLRDYFRLSPADTRTGIASLVEDGVLLPVSVKGWDRPAYLHRDTKLPRRVEGRALLSPFDPLVWERGRTESLFDFRYRIEIYVPAEKRQHGYYVLPFLLRDRIAARVDLKADRAEKVLRVLAAHAEPEAPSDTAEELGAELRLMAEWLKLDTIAVSDRGDLAPGLRAIIG